MAIIMDGKALAVNMQEQLQEKVARLKEKEWIVPGLVVIMVGENPASQVYVRNKERAAEKKLASIVRRSIFLRVSARKN